RDARSEGWLTGPAERGGFLATDLPQLPSAAWAGLSSAQAHLQELAVLGFDVGWHQLPQALGRVVKDGAHRFVEAVDLLWSQRAALAKGRELRRPQDLVAVGVADAGHEPVVAQQRLQLAGMAADSLSEDLQGQRGIVGVRAHLRPARDTVELIWRDQVELAEHLAVDISQLATLGESQAQPRSRAHALARIVNQPDATCEHRVGGEQPYGLAVSLEGKQQEFAAVSGRADREAGEAGKLGRRSAQEDGSRSRRLRDRLARCPRRQLLGDHGQIGQFRHGEAPLTVWYATPALQQTTS